MAANVVNRKMPPPFKSTPDGETKVDRLLARWEAWNAGVKTFDCHFKRWTYDTVFGPPNRPKFVDLGTIKYAAPDKSLFRVDATEKNGKQCPVENARAEHWTFDGKSIIEYNHRKKAMIVHKLPPEFQGSKLVDGPLAFGVPALAFSSLFGLPVTCPFPFAATAKQLKEQYFLHEVTPRNAPPTRYGSKPIPARERLPASMHHLQLIFRASDMSPFAMRLTQPNGKDYVVYQFYDVAVNKPPKPADDPFHPAKPFGRQKMIEETPTTRRPANEGRR